MSLFKNYLSAGDFIDLYYKLKQKGYRSLAGKFQLSNRNRTMSKWNTDSPSSDFWIIPAIRSRWNEKCSGDSSVGYEDYFVNKYLAGKQNLSLLSVGCGTGSRERKFSEYEQFKLIVGIDFATVKVEEARMNAAELNLHQLKYFAGDFLEHPFEKESYDVILFNSSLHHFNHIQAVLQENIIPLLKKDGFLVLFEYVGPNRLQWSGTQLEAVNKLNKALPERYKLRFDNHSLKRHIYRPGLWRMLLVDPSEAVDSASILPAVHLLFDVIEEKKIGWDILHLLLKDIAHNFLNEDKDTLEILSNLFEYEDQYMMQTSSSDAIFGIYQKK